jgi:uncharacterized protein YegP (UPF0339 family)
MYFEIYPSGNLLYQQWRWRLKAANHEPIANGGESYVNRADCLYAINLIKGTTIMTPVREAVR